MEQIGFEEAYAEFENSITSPALKQVAQHWRSICRPGRLPGWADLRPSAIKAHLPIVWSYDYDTALDDFVGRLAGIEISSEETLDAFPEKFLAVSPVRFQACLHRFLELSCQRHLTSPASFDSCSRSIGRGRLQCRGPGVSSFRLRAG